MVYPILKINQDDSNDIKIVIIDTEYENELSIQDTDDIPSLFYILTNLFLSQNKKGNKMGYKDFSYYLKEEKKKKKNKG